MIWKGNSLLWKKIKCLTISFDLIICLPGIRQWCCLICHICAKCAAAELHQHAEEDVRVVAVRLPQQTPAAAGVAKFRLPSAIATPGSQTIPPEPELRSFTAEGGLLSFMWGRLSRWLSWKRLSFALMRSGTQAGGDANRGIRAPAADTRRGQVTWSCCTHLYSCGRTDVP